MLAWKLSSMVAAAAVLAAVVARADDPPLTITVGSAQTESAAGEAHEPAATLTLTGTLDGTGIVMSMRSEYWLGVVASRPSPALQAQLKLPKDQGLVVEALQPGSPAAKGGIQQYDILLKANDKPLSGLHDLQQLINQVKGGKLTFDLLRAGKHETVTVTPTKRPAHEPGEMGALWIPEGAAARSLNVGPNLMPGRPLEFRIIRPGQILPPGGALPAIANATVDVTVHTKAKLADGSNVEITQRGAEPAKVVVTRDKDKWEGTSGDLSKIPEKIRPEVEKLLRPPFDRNRFFTRTGEGTVTIVGSAEAAPGLPAPLAVSPDIERRLGAMQKQLDELRHSVDALQGKAKEKSAAKPE